MNSLTISDLRIYDDLPYEIVERKGIGHPDTLADAIADEASRAYSQYCLKHFGRIAHHWFDKVMLLGGESQLEFGKGKIIYPYTVIFAGKAALRVGTHEIPLKDIFFEAASKVLSTILKGFKPKEHLEIEVKVYDYRGPGQKSKRYRPEGIEDLVALTDQARKSNDCNICIGYAPLTILEKIVLELEQELSLGDFKKCFPDTGYDIKIIGTRKEKHIILQVNLPFIADLVPDHATYLQRVKESESYITHFVKKTYGLEVDVEVNPEKINNRAYLTVTGTVADTGDIGAVGRGNRLNGLITPFRPMSIEAASGKNPLDHTGRLYSLFAINLANEIYNNTKLKNIVMISTTKDKLIHEPDNLIIQVENWDKNEKQYAAKIRDLSVEALKNISELTREMVA